MLRAATLPLPRGVARDRYRQEFLAELWGLPSREQAREAVSLLVHSPALWSAVRGDSGSLLEDTMTKKPLLCRLGLNHRWEAAQTSDGQRFVRCRRCLKERDGGSNWHSFTAMGA